MAMGNSKSYFPRTIVKSKKDANLPTLPTKIEGKEKIYCLGIMHIFIVLLLMIVDYIS